jgi:hypothetical protein
MTMGPPDEMDDSEMGPDDAAAPARPSERGWRERMREDEADEADGGVKRVPLA